MISIKFNSILPFFLLGLLIGCGGGTANSAKDLDAIEANNVLAAKDIEDKIVGYWVSASGNDPEFEFFSSSTDNGFDIPIKTGKIFENGRLVNRFFWSLRLDGSISLSLVDGFCQRRPINSCSTLSYIEVQARGKSISNAEWSIRYEDINRISQKTIANKYSKKNIDVAVFSQGEFFLSQSEIFDHPVAGQVDSNTISLFIDRYKEDAAPLKISAQIDAQTKNEIFFKSDKTLATEEVEEFYIEDVGYRFLAVKVWYEDMVLSASEKNKYSLRYKVRREIQIPSEINLRQVQVSSDFDPLLTVTESYELINRFIDAPIIKAMDKFYSNIDFGVDNERIFNGTGNELFFASNEEASVSLVDSVIGKSSNTTRRLYSWSQGHDGAILLKAADSQNIKIRFIKPVNGGYNVLYTLSDGTHERHDLILDAPLVMDENKIPGRYRFLSSDGWSTVEVQFHKDKTVTSVPSLVNGYWMQDSNGDIISFECTELSGRDITDYHECYADFERYNEMQFVHIRRLRFMHQDGDHYQMAYDASFYGDVFNTTSISKEYLSLSWTYRWTRVGGDNEELP
jgi:hypothetical protein